MPFPPSEREVYETNPLNQVICQIRFPAILKIGTDIPSAFQEDVRATYPVYEENSAFPLELPQPIQESISGLLASMPMGVPIPATVREHHFFTEDRSRSISLTTEFIAVSDASYMGWETFRPAVELAEATLRKVYEPAYYSRIGLRYVDMLDRQIWGIEDTPWSHLLNPSFIGMLGVKEVAKHMQSLSTEALIGVPNVSGGFVRIKHGLATSQSDDKQVYVIDSDFFTEQRRDYATALNDLDIFHELGGYLFRWAAQPALRDELRGHP